MAVGQFNSQLTPLTLANLQITDQYHVAGIGMPHTLIKDVVFPYARGRQFMQIGGEFDDNSAFSISFAEQPPHYNRIYAPTADDFWDLVNDIAELQQSDPVTTLLFHGLSTPFENMRWSFTLTSAPLVLSKDGAMWVYATFSLETSQYKVGA